MIKSELRKVFLERRRSLTRAEVDLLSYQISDRVFAIVDLQNIRTLHCFISIREMNEIDTSLIFARLWAEFPAVRTVVPRVDPQTKQLEHLEYNASTPMEKNKWGIAEPVGDELISSSEIDVVLIPGLCFDERGHRVGYGKGYYDKFLSQCRRDCQKIGLSFFSPIPSIENIGPHDITVDACVLPDDVAYF